jgi:phage/plasmid-like protein (TIGR03299 family)
MHAIEIQEGRAMAAFNRKPAWHVLGEVGEFGTPRDGMKAAGLLDWQIQPYPTYIDVGGRMVEVDSKLGQVFGRRLLNGQVSPLSMVGPSTVPHQNEDLLLFAETLLSIGVESMEGLEFEATGSLQDGKRVWVLIRIPGAFDIGGDKIVRYLCVETSHDGKGATKAFITYIRVVCWNTLSAAANEAVNKYTIPHLRDILMQRDVPAARETLNLHLKVDPVLTEIVSQWQDTIVTEGQWEEIVKNYAPDVPVHSTDRQKRTVVRKRAALNDLYFRSDTIGEFKGTKWGAVNAITEAYQWAPGSQTSKESLAKRQMAGAAANERAAVRLVDSVLAGV